MKSRPILMHARSIENLLAGRKTQTRRIASKAMKVGIRAALSGAYEWWTGFMGWQPVDPSRPMLKALACPYGEAGDLLWVREAWALSESEVDTVQHAPRSYADELRIERLRKHLKYRADGDSYDEVVEAWRPSIHMPRWASRLTLRLTDVRVERVQDISAADILAEGVQVLEGAGSLIGFERLWDDTNGPGAWDRNDWVWALTFEVLRENVDAAIRRLEAAA